VTGRRGAVLAVACGVAAGAAAGCGGGPAGGAGGQGQVRAGDGTGPLRWSAPPLVFTPETLPGDRILTGRLRNDSVRRVRVRLSDVRVLARDGAQVAAQPVFLQTFGKPLWAPGREPGAIPESELRRIGRLAFVRPGEELPLTVAWHAAAGRPAAVDYGIGRLPVP
jgi:hypothetical protein